MALSFLQFCSLSNSLFRRDTGHLEQWRQWTQCLNPCLCLSSHYHKGQKLLPTACLLPFSVLQPAAAPNAPRGGKSGSVHRTAGQLSLRPLALYLTAILPLLSWPEPPQGLTLPQLNDWVITFALPSEVANGNTTSCKMCFPLSLN